MFMLQLRTRIQILVTLPGPQNVLRVQNSGDVMRFKCTALS